jgi:DNA/RNA-binding domain of Phe-tRNA-synthetase-like protein
MLSFDLDLPDLLIGWVRAKGVTVGESPPALATELDVLVAEPTRWGLDDATRVGIRGLLRGHGYKPSGRGKPASEFLVRAATDGTFPRINNLVDINNLVSLESGWPISILDADRAGADDLVLRHGRPDEAYVFNPAGHEIGLNGLLCVAVPDGAALGNPVKDSMTTKLSAETDRVLGVIYASRQVADEEQVAVAAARLAGLIEEHAGAGTIASGVLGPTAGA